MWWITAPSVQPRPVSGFLRHLSRQWALRVSQIDHLESGAAVFEDHLVWVFSSARRLHSASIE